MKKNILLNIALLAILTAPCMSGCGLFDDDSSSSDSNVQEEDKGQDVVIASGDDFSALNADVHIKNITFTHDIEVFAINNFATSYGDYSNCTIDGQGHTIKVIGNPGSVTDSNGERSVFGTLKNVTIKDLNVIYDIKLKEGQQMYYGGLASKLIDSKMTNCSVKFLRSLSMEYQRSNKACGGIVGGMFNSEMSYCSVEGELNFKMYSECGGLVGLMDNSVIHHCTFKGSTISTGPGCVGGIVSDVDNYSQVYACEVYLDGFQVHGQNPNAGLAIASTGDKCDVHDILIKATPNLKNNFVVTKGEYIDWQRSKGIVIGRKSDLSIPVRRVIADFRAMGDFEGIDASGMSDDIGTVSGANGYDIYVLTTKNTNRERKEIVTSPGLDGLCKIEFDMYEYDYVPDLGYVRLHFNYNKETDELNFWRVTTTSHSDMHASYFDIHSNWAPQFYETKTTAGVDTTIFSKQKGFSKVMEIKIEKMFENHDWNQGFYVTFIEHENIFLRGRNAKHVNTYKEISFTYNHDKYTNGEEIDGVNYWRHNGEELVIDMDK